METPPSETLTSKESPRAIIGIGASAGGLEALRDFLRATPEDTDMAFVIVQHLEPHHESMLAQVLTPFTTMKVVQVEEYMDVEPNRVYAIPPNRYLALSHGALRLTPPEAHRMPIDFFFRSLAEDQKEKSVCVILSGTGSDGTPGARAANIAGGVVYVQDPKGAKYDGMPRSAIEGAYADFVLSPEKMGAHLVVHLRDHFGIKALTGRVSADTADTLVKIIQFVRSKTGHDFSLYKKNMLHRRVLRRMGLAGIDDMALYYRYLQENPDEAGRLFREVLVLVSSFFRDEEAFHALKARILPMLAEDRPDDYEFRVWVPGCARGEEAYSIAMTIREYADEQNRQIRFQVFGTDLDDEAISRARAGIYPETITDDVSPERLMRFFVKEEKGYRIVDSIREHMVFAVHDMVKDPPFARLDLVSCRNLLIYFEPELQGRLIGLFHYALRPGAILFLGTSENIGTRSELFESLDEKLKFFRAKGVSGLDLRAVRFVDLRAGNRGVSPPLDLPKQIDSAALVHRAVMERFGPPSVLADEKGQILYFYGDATRYLPHPSGNPTTNVFDLAREGISSALGTVWRHALTQNKEVVRKGVAFGINDETCTVTLVVRPLPQKGGPTLLLVTFLDEPVSVEKTVGEAIRVQHDEPLERELAYTRESLQTTIEQLQHSNEDLKLANEELQSMNEELQSMNEQREVSREELQSMNEELYSVNAELHLRVEQLSRTENVLENLIENTNVGTIYVDSTLHIVRFTPEAAKVVPLITTDVGRNLSDMATNLVGEDLVAAAGRVTQTGLFEEKDARAKDGTGYLMRIMPYRASDQQAGGVVITFTDITQVKKLTEETMAREYAEAVVDTVREPLLILDGALHVVSANQTFYRLFGVSQEETEGAYVFDLGNGQWDIPALRKLLEELLPANKVFHDFPGRARVSLSRSPGHAPECARDPSRGKTLPHPARHRRYHGAGTERSHRRSNRERVIGNGQRTKFFRRAPQEGRTDSCRAGRGYGRDGPPHSGPRPRTARAPGGARDAKRRAAPGAGGDRPRQEQIRRSLRLRPRGLLQLRPGRAHPGRESDRSRSSRR